jgi:hypothetical protein
VNYFVNPTTLHAVAVVVTSTNHRRIPRIHFRHGKRDVIDALLGLGKLTSSAVSKATGQHVIATTRAPASHHPDAIDPLSLPPMYGRLPPMDDEEMMLVEMGGAL